MYKVTKIAVYSLTILLATLISEYIIKFIDHYKDRSYKSVLIGMVIYVAIFYPMFTYMDKYIKKISSEYIKGSKRITSNSTVGFIVGYFIALFALFIFFAKIWYNLDVFKDIKSLF